MTPKGGGPYMMNVEVDYLSSCIAKIPYARPALLELKVSIS